MSEEYTPVLDDVREAWIYWQACASLKPSKETGAEFDRAIARIKADALREIESSLIDWDVIYGHEKATPEIAESHRIATFIGIKAEEIEEAAK